MAAKIKTRAHSSHTRLRHKPKGVSHHQFEKVYWPYIPIVLLIGLFLSVGFQSGTLQAAVRHPLGKVLDYSTSMSISGLLADTNAARAANGVGGLSLNSQLDAAAQAKANDMSARDYWSHDTPDGNPPWIFVTAQGYNYQKLGENLATGFSDEQSTIDGWMASPPHRANMLDTDYTDVGFGYINILNYTAAGGGPQTLVVAFYGEPAAAAPAAAPAASTPAATTPTNTTPPAATPAQQPAASTPAASTTPTAPVKQAVTATKKPKVLPTNTDNPSKGITLSYKTSRAQLAFARFPIATFATGMVVFGGFAAAGLWISRHLLTMRRVFAYGEAFVVHHPLVDVGLLVITALSFMMSQTAGFIK